MENQLKYEESPYLKQHKDNPVNWMAWNKENLKKETTKYLDIFKDHPYIFNLGHGVLPETDPSMMDYLVKIVKDY